MQLCVYRAQLLVGITKLSGVEAENSFPKFI